MKKPPIELTVTTMTTKVAPAAQARLRELASKHGARISDVVSACLLFMPEEDLARILAEQKATLDALPKAVRGMVRNLDKLSEEDRAMLRDLLS